MAQCYRQDALPGHLAAALLSPSIRGSEAGGERAGGKAASIESEWLQLIIVEQGVAVQHVECIYGDIPAVPGRAQVNVELIVGRIGNEVGVIGGAAGIVGGLIRPGILAVKGVI